MRRWGTIGFAILASCSSDPIIVMVPFLDTDQSAIVAIERGDAIELIAVDAADRAERPLLRSIDDFNEDVPMHLTALMYGAPLKELGLEPGVIAYESNGSPVPSQYTEAMVTQVIDAEIEWVKASELSPRLRDFRLELNETGCVTFAPGNRYMFAEHEEVVVVQPLDEQSAVVVTGGMGAMPKFYRVDGQGMTQLQVDLGHNATVYGGTRGRDGRIWLCGGKDDRSMVWGGRPENGFVVEASEVSTISSRWPHWMVAAGDGEPADTFYLLSRRNTLSRLSNGTWSELATHSSGSSSYGAMSWRGPEDVLYLRTDGKKINRYLSGNVTEEPTNVDIEIELDTEVLHSVISVAGGDLVGTKTGTLLGRVNDQEGWGIVGTPAIIGSKIASFLPLRPDSVLAAGRYGMIQQFSLEDEEYCVDNRFFGGSLDTIEFLARVGDLILAGGENEGQAFLQEVAMSGL